MTQTNKKYIFEKGIPTETDLFANAYQWNLDFYHIPSGNSLQFKAMLSQFDDRFDSEWEEEDVYGRMDSIGNFKRTKRVISLGFDVPAGSVSESFHNLSQINKLIQFLYPAYERVYDKGSGNANNIAAAPMMKIKFMNMIYDANSPDATTAREGGLAGKMSGLNYSPDNDLGYFTFEGNLYPKLFRITFEFSVYHQHGLGWGKGGDSRQFSKSNFPYLIGDKERREIQDPLPIETVNKMASEFFENQIEAVSTTVQEVRREQKTRNRRKRKEEYALIGGQSVPLVNNPID